MEKNGEKIIIIEYEKKIEFLEKKISDLEIINLRLGETLSNVTFEMDSLVAKKELEIRVLKEKLEQTLAKIPKTEATPAEFNAVVPNPAEPNPVEPNPVFDDIPLDSPQNYLEIFEPRKIEIQRDENGYQCNRCDYISSYSKNFKEHYRTHTGEEPFGCKLCKQRFKSKSSCIRHIRGHDDRFKLKCSLCNYTATRTEYITIHAEKAHNGNQTCPNQVLKNESSPKSRPNVYPSTCKTKSNLFKRIHDQIE